MKSRPRSTAPPIARAAIWLLLAGVLTSGCGLLPGCGGRPDPDEEENARILEPPTPQESPPGTVLLCPVTGKPLDEEAALTYVHKGKLYYFDTQEALDAFKKDPEKYLRKP